MAFTPQHAAHLLGAWLGGPVNVERMQPLAGGMVNQVLDVTFDREPARAVLKVQPAGGQRRYFIDEYADLRHLRAHGFPAPEPYFLHRHEDGLGFDVLAMAFWDAVNMGAARLGREDRARIEREMADTLLALHQHQRDTYGRVDAPGSPDWAETFAARVRPRYLRIEQKISARTFAQIDAIIDHFDQILAGAGPPTLVHGDIWANNVMLTQAEDGWHLRGFVDPGALYADPAYELAYLEVFHTAGPAFFDAYTKQRPPDPGYALRRAAYWLNTMIIHVDHFGDAHYRQSTTALADQLAAVLGL